MAARKKKIIVPQKTDEQRQAERVEYEAAYRIMCDINELKRLRETLEALPRRREMAGANWAEECPWVGLPIGRSESDVIEIIQRLKVDLTPEKRDWMCSVMVRHLYGFNPSLYQID